MGPYRLLVQYSYEYCSMGRTWAGPAQGRAQSVGTGVRLWFGSAALPLGQVAPWWAPAGRPGGGDAGSSSANRSAGNRLRDALPTFRLLPPALSPRRPGLAFVPQWQRSGGLSRQCAAGPYLLRMLQMRELPTTTPTIARR